MSESEAANPDGARIEATESQETSAQSFLDMIEQIRTQVSPDEWKKLPTDLSSNIDHYLYGSPKVEG